MPKSYWLPTASSFSKSRLFPRSKADDGYDRTRAFYLAYGFRPLEEFPDLWGAENPALQLIKTIPSLAT